MVTNSKIQSRITLFLNHRVKIVVCSNAIYSGILWRKGKDHIILAHFCVHFKQGGTVASRSKTNRIFHIDKIKEITLI